MSAVASTAAPAREEPSPPSVARKVGYLCSLYPAISHTFVTREVRALRERGVEVHTFTIHRAGAENQRSEEDREEAARTYAVTPARWSEVILAHLRLLPVLGAYLATLRTALTTAPSGLRGHLWQVFYTGYAVVIWDRCRRLGIRHVHVHLANQAADSAMLAAELGNAIDGPDTWSWSFTMHGPTELFDVRFFRLAEKIARARFVVCISHFTRSQLMSLTDPDHWSKIHVVRSSVDAERFSPRGNGHRGATPEILSIGRLVPEKGFPILLQALAVLRARGRVFRARIAGGGTTLESLRAQATALGLDDVVQFPGPVGQDEIVDLYAGASIFCLASFAEGLPGVIFEAMAMEVPVVATRITGIPELVEHGRTGFLVAPGEVEELADALQELLDHPERWTEMGRAGRAKVVSDHNPRTLGKQMERLFAHYVWDASAVR